MATVIINEFLTFVQNKIDVLDEVSLIKICSDNYSDAEIETGKTVLFNSCGDLRIINRKGDDKKKKNIKDVIKVLKEVIDPDVQPTFVAKDLNRLPPITFDYIDVTRLLKDMTVMRSELTEFQTRISTELTDLRNSFDTHECEKNNSMTTALTTPKRNVRRTLPPALGPQPTPEQVSVHTPMYRDILIGPKSTRQAATGRARPMHSGENGMNTTESIRPTITRTMRTTTASVLPSNLHDEGGSFTIVQRKRRNKNVNMRGTLETNCKIQVAETQCSIYVSRTSKCVTEKDIREHIIERGEQCISVELLKQNYETSFNSFKVVIPSSKLNIFLDTGFWPSGTVYRRYRERQVRLAPSQKQNE